MGRKALKTVMTGYESVANNLLRQGVKNTSVIYDRLKEVGYKGSLSGIKRYVAANKKICFRPKGTLSNRREAGG